jgi:hypothetical protein
MGTDHPPRDKQAHLDKPSLWVYEPADEFLSLLENALREDEPSLGGGEQTEDVYSLLEENALLRGSSAIGPHPQNVVHAS